MTHSSLALSPRDGSTPLLRNALLASLPAATVDRLAPSFTVRRVQLGEVLRRPDAADPVVCFPLTAVVALRRSAADGEPVPVTTIGREGAAGLCEVLDEEARVEDDVVVVVPGTVATLPLEALRGEPQMELPAVAQRYVVLLLAQLAQDAACQRLHRPRERLVSMLLRCSEQAQAAELHLTQETLAQLIGTRRAAVNAAATSLQRAGVLRYRRGRIQILDARSLSRGACGCWETMRVAYRELDGGRSTPPTSVRPAVPPSA